jgi:hypothetical protein
MVEEQAFYLQLQIDVILKRQLFYKLTEASIMSTMDGNILAFFPPLLWIRIYGSRNRIGICIKVKKQSCGG